MNLIKIAFRNVSRQKRRSNLLAIAIAFGVMMIILVNSLTHGLVQNTQTNFESALGGHIYISGEILLPSGRKANRIDNTAVLNAVIPQFSSFIIDSQKRSSISGNFIFRSKTTSGMVYGVHWDEEESLLNALSVVEGSLDRINEADAIVLPLEVMEKLNLVLNEKLLLTFDTVTGQANVGEFTIVAVTKDTSGLGFSAAYANIDYVNALLGLETDEYQSYNLILTSLSLVNPITEEIKQAIRAQGVPLKPEPEKEDVSMFSMAVEGMFGTVANEEPWEGTRFKVENLNDFMDMVTQVVAILDAVALGMFLIMLMITMVGLVNTFRMIMIERTQEIGTMRSVGMQKRDVTKLFLLEGLILALRGAFLGIIAAMVIGAIIRIIPFPDGTPLAILLHNGHISVPLVPSNIIMVTVIISIITVLAVWSPARKAAKLTPADALRL